MKNANYSVLINYLFPPLDNFITGGLIMLVGIIVLILESNLWIFAICLILGIYEILPDLSKIRRFLNQVNVLKSSKDMHVVLEDFKNADEHLNGNVLLGDNYIFGKKCGKVIKYSDIRRAHHFVRKNVRYGTKRFIEIFTFDGSKDKLCKLAATEDMLAEVENVMALIKEKAPDAQVSVNE